LLASFDVFESLNDEALAVISVSPAGLAGSLMVQHIGVGDEAVSLDALNLDAKDSTGNHHSDFGVLLEGELSVVRYLVANRVVVLLDVPDFF
jgi:hypothetical protein